MSFSSVTGFCRCTDGLQRMFRPLAKILIKLKLEAISLEARGLMQILQCLNHQYSKVKYNKITTTLNSHVLLSVQGSTVRPKSNNNTNSKQHILLDNLLIFKLITSRTKYHSHSRRLKIIMDNLIINRQITSSNPNSHLIKLNMWVYHRLSPVAITKTHSK